MATLAELEARLKAVRKERFELRPGLEVGDPAARARDRELAPENIYLENAVARAKNEQENTYTLIRVFADGWEIKDQTGRTVALGRSPEEVIERARENGARPEDLARIPPPPPPQPPPGDFTIRQTVTGAWAIDFGPRPIAEARTPEEAIAVVRNRIQTVLEPGSVPPLTDAIATDLVNRANTILAEQKAREEKAAADQGPGTESSGDTVAEAQAAREEGATTQNPEPQSTARTEPTNADASVSVPPTNIATPPKLPATAAAGSSAQPTGQTKTGPASATGISALQNGITSDAQQTYIYKAVAVTSRFSRGQFTQELEGVLLIFPEDVVRSQAEATRAAAAGTTPQAESGSTSVQADARRVDNAVSAQNAPFVQSEAETNRLAAAAGRAAASSTATQADVRKLDNLASAAAEAAPLVNSAIKAFAPAGSTALPGSLTALAGLANQNFSVAGVTNPLSGLVNQNSALGSAVTQTLAAAQNRPASSFGQPVGVGNNQGGAGQGTGTRTVTVQVPLISGGVATVTSTDQVLQLYNQGRITVQARDRALSQLAAQTTAQQPQQAVQTQSVGYEP